MRVMVLLLALASVLTFAAGNAVTPPQAATGLKPQATGYGVEAITIPQMLSYQGKLTDTLGQPVPNGNYQLTFRLYTQLTGGSALWTEAQTILVKGGLFAALLGALTPITSLPESGACYLSLQVAANPELSPRQRIVSAAYSYLAARSANADLLQGKDTTALDSRYVNEGQTSSVTSNMIVDGTIAAADLGQMGASSGQVMKWTGSAWAPRNDSVGGGGGGGTVTSVGQATGVVCSPNPITTTGTVRLDTAYSDGRYIKNQNSVGQSASFQVTGTGQAAQFHGISAVATNPAIYGEGGLYGSGVTGTCGQVGFYGVMGDGGTVTTGVYGHTNSSSYFGVRGINDHTLGTGIVGAGDSASPTTYGYGSGGAFTGIHCGAYGNATNTTNSGGTGFYGESHSSMGFGVEALNHDSSGTGIIGVGSGLNSLSWQVSGGAFNGKKCGVYGESRDSATGTCGGSFKNGKGDYAYVAYYSGGTHYKINGTGSVSTIMATREGKKNLFAPEMPEAYFEDCGEGQLSNGHCRVNLEKLFSDCITVNAEHPLKVFVQLEDDCKGVYVNKDATGFDVRELQGGTSNARFSWRVLAKWKGNENVRLPDAPGPEPTRTVKIPTSVQVKTSSAAPQSEPVTK